MLIVVVECVKFYLSYNLFGFFKGVCSVVMLLKIYVLWEEGEKYCGCVLL